MGWYLGRLNRVLKNSSVTKNNTQSGIRGIEVPPVVGMRLGRFESRKLYRKLGGAVLRNRAGMRNPSAQPESFFAEQRETKSCIAWIEKRKSG
jgi:hypothetical protein